MQSFRGKNIILEKFQDVFAKLRGLNIFKIIERGFSTNI
jgi:hypothetical protein